VAPKKAAATKTKAAAKPKANTGTKRAKKTPTAVSYYSTLPESRVLLIVCTQAPAVVDEKKILTKTKSGRVTKTKPSATAPKKTPTKKAASAKKATPKKAEAPAAAA